MKFTYSSGGRLLILICFVILSAYVVYRQATDLSAIDLGRQIVRHENMLAGQSEFFNPWQYRILSTYLVEGFYQAAHALVYQVDRIKAFIIFRFFQNLLIFYVAYKYFKNIKIQNPWLILVGILMMSFFMGNSVFNSDLSFNTYFDILFYLLAALAIINQKFFWIIPLTFMAALNRETSALIPVMLVVPFVDWKAITIPKRVLWTSIVSSIIFTLVFIALRFYYGYKEHASIDGMNSPYQFLIYNLRFLKVYPELVGTLAFLPIVVTLYLKRIPLLLQQWFWIVCPVWFIIHFSFSLVVESRLFLVPQILIFIPGFLWLIENWYSKDVSTNLTE